MAASVSLSIVGNAFQFFTSGGVPLNAGKIYTYAAGTSTPLATYTEPTGTVPNANPITLNADGRTPQEIWLLNGSAYKFILTDSLGNQIATYDNLSGPINSSSIFVSGAPQYVATVGGTGNIITLTPAQTATSYFAGQSYTFTPIANNTGATSVNVSGLGAQSLFTKNGLPCTGGELLAGGFYMIAYSSALSAMVLVNSDDRTSITAFTPRLAFGGSSVGITYAFRSGAYFKVGNIVYFSLDIFLSSKGAAPGAATIEDLPFPVAATFPSGSAPIAAAAVRNLTFASGYVYGLFSGSSLNIVNSQTAANFTFLGAADFANNTEILISGFYATN